MDGVKKRILLTGCEFENMHRGFIGGYFNELYKDKYEIVVFNEDIRWAIWDQVLDGIDMVVHLAALAGVRRSHEIPNEYWETNVVASKELFLVCEQEAIPIIYASSSSVYEWWLSPYAASKWAMEHHAPDCSLGLRFHTVYGKNSRKDMLYDKLLNHDVEYITNHTRDWTHVEDVCSAIDICIENFHEISQVAHWLDVGNGKPVSVKEMANHVWPNNNLRLKDVSGEREHTCADPTLLLQYGWEPKHYILD